MLLSDVSGDSLRVSRTLFLSLLLLHKGFILLGQNHSEGMLRLFAAVKILETGTDDFIDRGRAFRVASERLHQAGSFQRSQRIAGSLSLCVGMGVAVNDRQGFQHPFKINPRGIFAFSSYGKFFVLLFKLWSIRRPIR